MTVRCPKCDKKLSLTDAYGPVGSKVWYCACGEVFGPGADRWLHHFDPLPSDVVDRAKALHPAFRNR